MISAWTRKSPLTWPTGRAGRPEQADLPGPLGHGHRQRVEDEERAAEQRQRRDERGRGLEVDRRGADRRRQLGRAGEDVRLVAEPLVERHGDGVGSRAIGQLDIDPRRRRRGEDRLRLGERDDDGPSVGRGQGSGAGQDPDDRLGARAIGPQQGDRATDLLPGVARQPLGDEGSGSGDPIQPDAGGEVEVVDECVGDRVDAEDGDRRRGSALGGLATAGRDRSAARGSASRPSIPAVSSIASASTRLTTRAR